MRITLTTTIEIDVDIVAHVSPGEPATWDCPGCGADAEIIGASICGVDMPQAFIDWLVENTDAEHDAIHAAGDNAAMLAEEADERAYQARKERRWAP